MWQKRKVLLVEDEFDMSYIIEQTLSTNEFSVCRACNGREALSAYARFSPEIIIMDRLLPDMDGLEVVSHIRGFDKKIPILIHSVMIDLDDVLRGFDCGVNDYIRKPCEMDELLARVKTHLNSAALFSGGSCNIGSYVLDYVTQRLSFRDEDIQLTYMEFILLKTLAENLNQCVPFSTLLPAMWKNYYYPASDNIHVYVSHLRAILSRDKRVRILNMRSVGYKLIVK